MHIPLNHAGTKPQSTKTAWWTIRASYRKLCQSANGTIMEANLISGELSSHSLSSISKQARNRRAAPRWNNVIRTHYGCFILLHSVFCVQLLGCWPTLSGKDINSALKTSVLWSAQWCAKKECPGLDNDSEIIEGHDLNGKGSGLLDRPLEERRTGSRKIALLWIFFS